MFTFLLIKVSTNSIPLPVSDPIFKLANLSLTLWTNLFTCTRQKYENLCSFFTATGHRCGATCSLSIAPEGRCSASLTRNALAFTRKFFESMFIRDLTKFYAGCQLPNANLLYT